MNLLLLERSPDEIGQFLIQLESFALALLLFVWLWHLFSKLKLARASSGRPPLRSLERPLAIVVFLGTLVWSCQDLPVSLWFFNFEVSLALGLSLLSPSLALGNVLAFLILRPWEILADQSSFLLALPRLLFALFVVSAVLAAQKPLTFRKPKSIEVLVFCFGIWIFLSTYVTSSPDENQGIYFDGFAKSLVLFFFIRSVAQRSVISYQSLSLSVVCGTFGILMVALANTAHLNAGDARLVARGSLENANDLAAILILALPLLLIPLLRSKKSFWLFIIGPLAIFFLIGIWQARSRAAVIGVFLIVIGSVFVKVTAAWSRRSTFLALGGSALLGLMAVFVLSQASLGRGSADLDESRTNRMAYWKAGLAMAVRNPILGVGFQQYPRNFSLYGQSGITEEGKRTAHSSWILALSEAGLPALLFLISIFILALKRAWQLRFEAPELLLSLIGYGVAMSFLSHTYTLYPYLLLGLVFGYPDTPRRET